MAIHLSSLKEEEFPQVYKAFCQAFSDYAVDQSAITETRLFNRMVKNGVDLESSVGAFDDGRLVGMMLVGFDTWKGKPAGFDALTGIVPEYRDRGIGGQIFELVLFKLKVRGVRSFILEVLQSNRPAVRAYRHSGFKVTREFDCYILDPERLRPSKPKAALDIRRVEKNDLGRFEPFLDWTPSWENSFASLRRIPDEVILWGAFENGTPAGLLAYYPGLSWIMSLIVDKSRRRAGVASSLLSHLVKETEIPLPFVKALNVERTDPAMAGFFLRSGFDLFATQYEMELELSL